MTTKTDWITKEYGKLIGKTVKSVRLLQPTELADFGWEGRDGFLIAFTDGTVIIPSSDPEGNDCGFLFVEQLETAGK